MTQAWGGTVSSIDFSERWMRDGVRVAESVGGICSLNIDMSSCAAIIQRFKEQGTPIRYASVIVCATAKALARHPELQKLVAGNRKLSGGDINVCLSISSDEILTSVVIVEKADRKTALEIGLEVLEKAPLARSETDQMMGLLRRLGWLVPFGFLRRQIIRSLLGQLWYRRKVSGTFQVTILPGVDFVAAQVFNTAAVLAVGGISLRPVVVDGEVTARLMAPFTCTIDHKQLNGQNALVFLTELKNILEREADSLF